MKMDFKLVEGSRQFKNWQYRMGTEPSGNPFDWALPYRDKAIMEQALDARSQFEWFAEAKWCPA